MKRRSTLMVAAFVGMALVTAACGGGSDGAADESVAESAAPVSTAKTDETSAPEVADTEAPPESEAPPATDAAEELTASDIGITEDTIKVAVAVADLGAIRAAGISLPETLTTEHLFARMTVYADKWNSEGGINGRQVEFIQVVWNPLDPTTFDSLCAAATLDDEIFAILNNTGLTATSMQCIVDAGMPIMYGDVTTDELLATGLVVTTAAPATVNATEGVKVWAQSSDVAAGSTIGVLSSNSPLIAAAGDAATAALEELGFNVVLVQINSLGGDNAATNEEGAAAVNTFIAEGAVHSFVTTPFTENTGFWQNAAGKLPYTLLDTASSQCAAFGLSRAPAASSGSECVTSAGHATVDLGGGAAIREETPFEIECRAFWDTNFSDYFGGASMPGVPSGQKPVDVNGQEFISDYDPGYCTINTLFHTAMTNAGVNPTRESFMDALLDVGEFDIANGSNGQGFLAPDKPWGATALQTIRLSAADTTTQPDANGLYNGCAAPVNCAVVISDWVAIESG